MLNTSAALRGHLPLKTILTLLSACATPPRCSGTMGPTKINHTPWHAPASPPSGLGGIKPHRVSGTLELLWKLWIHEHRPARRILIEEQICRLCKPLVTAGARSIHLGFSGCDMDDMMQEGFIALLSCLRRYTPDRGVDLAAFVSKRVRGAMLDMAEKQRRAVGHGSTSASTSDGGRGPIDDARDPATDDAEPQWIIDLEVAYMLQPLTPVRRHIVMLCILDGHNTREAGRRLGIHASTVSRQLRAALATIHRNLVQ